MFGACLRTTLSATAVWMLLASVSFPAECRDFKQALPGYSFQFPADHASHDLFKTEWWYYTGHLKAGDGRKFGFELTFFRTGAEIEDGIKDSPWTVNNIYLAHMAVSDLKSGKFFFDEKMSRAAFDKAGADSDKHRVWIDNWSAESKGKKHLLKASGDGYAFNLSLTAKKGPVIHGMNGVSQKASCKGCASHYYSISRMAAEGMLTAGGIEHAVKGTAWMDHEFGSNQLSEEQVGWDWFSIQLQDGTDLMLYVMRRADGSYDPNSSGTLVAADGRSAHLEMEDFSIAATGHWQSPESGGEYPMGWEVKLPEHDLELVLKPSLENQELITKRSTKVSYWEGSCTVTGRSGGAKVSGDAYVEMTGYAEKFKKGI